MIHRWRRAALVDSHPERTARQAAWRQPMRDACGDPSLRRCRETPWATAPRRRHDLDPNISEEKLQKIAQVWELFFENAKKRREPAEEAWLADPVGFNTHYNQVVTSPKNSNRRQAPAYSPGPRRVRVERRSKVIDDDVPSCASPSVR